ncbi:MULTISPECIES: LysE family translocator [Rheinheimera]|jgi:threonine/homoserine/homoserine lactone efflux protein|uniref:LysE family translocator n=1 Tax=Rheinheimera TaxID=67575 RepID=UPI000E8423E1|nr:MULTISPECIES: LysE family translocator [Rheinheimera]MCD1599317.1 LysE family translocator [Rheinheimera aquimaris]HBN88032.1 LysE family translocator [Rheinheimera sp.]|tara:strand:+ start:2809 stop:3441 length:633 start_codon:yes stop_codon:yes gene_type:complete
MDLFLAVLFFAFSTTITPGPNNVMIMSSGMNYGIRASLPHLAGICLGFPLMVLLVGLGFGVVFERYPNLHQLIKVLGIAYLIWLAWHIAVAEPKSIAQGKSKPFSFIQAALFQWVNGKAWVMASGAVAAFTSVGGIYWIEVSVISAAFLLVAFPCVGLWLVCGSALRKILTQPLFQRIFNITMAIILVLSIVPVLMEVWQFYFMAGGDSQ